MYKKKKNERLQLEEHNTELENSSMEMKFGSVRLLNSLTTKGNEMKSLKEILKQ